MKLIWGIVAMAITTSTALAQAGGVRSLLRRKLKQMAQKLGSRKVFAPRGRLLKRWIHIREVSQCCRCATKPAAPSCMNTTPIFSSSLMARRP